MKKQEMLDIISDYRKQIEFHNYLSTNIQEIKNKYHMVLIHLSSSNDLEHLITRKRNNDILDGISGMISIFSDIKVSLMMTPFINEKYKDIWSDIMMITPRDRDKPSAFNRNYSVSAAEGKIGYYNIEICKLYIERLFFFYDYYYTDYKSKYIKVTPASEIIDDILYCTESDVQYEVKLSSDGINFEISKNIYRANTLSDKHNSFDELFVLHSYGTSFVNFDQAEGIILEYINECYPHFAI